ncbi:hypothetical protein B484DRAFT_410224 [Ochromonadaceae sp. CCMP2298]|nr:hypothetical protein B484DRAFT_410224 [Ochromonadaceae sp. CCMP2298]
MRRRPIAGADTVAAFHSLAGMGVLSGRVGGSLLSMQRAPFALIKVRASSSSTSHPGSAGSVKSHSQGAKAFSTAMQMAEEAQQTQRVVPVHPVYAATTATTPAPDSAPFPGPSLHGPRGQDWWTGLQPLPGVCPGVAADGTLHSLPQLRLPSGPLPVGTSAAQRASAVRMQLQQYFDNTWTMTEVKCNGC